MILRQNMQGNHLFRLVLVGVLVTTVALGPPASTRALATQPPPGQGIVYVTRLDDQGAILRPLDLKLGLFTTIVKDLFYPFYIICSSNGFLYITESGREQRIWRFKQDGTGRAIVAEWDINDLVIGTMVFAPNGDLFFGTGFASGAGLDTSPKGVWRIPGVLEADREFNPPEQVLPAELISGEPAFPLAFLNAGPFMGDLLVVLPFGLQPRVVRVAKPYFNTITEFIPYHSDPETGLPFRPLSLAVNSEGDVFVADYNNSKILRYDSVGSFQGVFAGIFSPSVIAIGPDDTVYITNATLGRIRLGGLFVFDAHGTLLASADFPMALHGVTVCAPQ